MERRQAMAASAMGALVLAAGAVTVKTVNLHRPVPRQASASPVPQTAPAAANPEPPSPPATIVVTRYEEVADRYVIPTPVSTPLPSAGELTPPAAGAADPVPGSPQPGSTSTTTPPAAGTLTTTSAPVTTTSGPGTAATSTTATTGATATTRPPGVPADWPADQPIPPMPPGCRDPQLEDNGEWNCQH